MWGDAEGSCILRPGDTAYVVALASLDVFPRQLVELVFRAGAEAAWHRVRAGVPGVNVSEEVARRWASQAARVDPPALLDAHRAAGVGVSVFGSTTYPDVLVDDPEAPLVLFSRGDPAIRSAPRVGIVGTRRPTAYGLTIATAWAETLSHAGVSIVSGLALGIDAAAHEGALRGPTPPIGVVGSGLDVVYPRRNRALWQAVAERGLLQSEYPLGVPAIAAHFPARNRIIAALSDVLLVVESQHKGGSLITAGAALARDRTVLAVPGSLHSPASAGTNLLLRDGGAVALDPEDVLVLLELSGGGRRTRVERRAQPDAAGRSVLDAFAWAPANVETLASRTGRSLVELADVLEQLVATGWLRAEHGWYERIADDVARGLGAR